MQNTTRKWVIFTVSLTILFIIPATLVPFLGWPSLPARVNGDRRGLSNFHYDATAVVHHSDSLVTYSAMEDFEAYTAGDDINGKSGPLGNWITIVNGVGCESSKVYNDNGNLVMDVMDDSGSGSTNAKVNFNVKGTINGNNIVTWRQRILVAGYNVVLFEGASYCIQVQFSGGDQVCYYAPNHSGLVGTGLTFGSGWETYEVLLYSTSQFMLRQYKSGVWSSWVGPFDMRTHWSSTDAVCSAWDVDGNTAGLPRVLADDIGVVWCTNDVNDTTPPIITTSGFSGLAIEQGDIASISWTLADVHPSIYTLYLNDVAIRSGSYMTGTMISIQIDSSTLSTLNYTMIARDTFGNVESLTRLISVVGRTDGGIFLEIGVNTINRNASQGIILTLEMSHWAVLYFDVSITVAPTSLVLPAVLPLGLVIALPVAFNLKITNSSALSSGLIRIGYNQSTIANQVNENTIVPMRWNEGTSLWVPTTSGLSRSENYIDIPLSENGLYIIAAEPKYSYIPIIIIVLIGVTGGIVAVAGYNHSHKKSLKVKGTGTGKGKVSSTYSPIPSGSTEQPFNESLAKRARLMQSAAPATTPRPSAAALFGSVKQQAGSLEDVKKKASTSIEPVVDIAARAASAQGMASEVTVERVESRCVVHKGPISELSYTCKQCGTVYCMKCAKQLSETSECCWTCKSPLSLSEEDYSENTLRAR